MIHNNMCAYGFTLISVKKFAVDFYEFSGLLDGKKKMKRKIKNPQNKNKKKKSRRSHILYWRARARLWAKTYIMRFRNVVAPYTRCHVFANRLPSLQSSLSSRVIAAEDDSARLAHISLDKLSSRARV